MLYNQDQTQLLDHHQLHFIEVKQTDRVMTITLNRPEKKNALHPVMIRELAFALHVAQHREDVWLVLLRARGNVFCAGADLKALAGMGEEIYTTIPEPSGELLLGELFSYLHKPIIAVVEGSVFAGGFLLLTGCTYVIANEDIVLSLPETQRGLFPFQVMAALMQVMPRRKVLDWCIRAYNLDVKKACEWGLITHVTVPQNMEQDLHTLKEDILQNAPKAISMGLQAFAYLQRKQNREEHTYLKNMLVQTLQTQDAQEGLAAFRQKRTPNWTNT